MHVSRVEHTHTHRKKKNKQQNVKNSNAATSTNLLNHCNFDFVYCPYRSSRIKMLEYQYGQCKIVACADHDSV